MSETTYVQHLRQARHIDDAVAELSHELRTPLTAIKGFVELLRDRQDVVDPAGLRYLEIIERNVERLHRTIDQITDSATAGPAERGPSALPGPAR